MGSICRWGAYSFDENVVNLVNFSRIARYSERNKRMQYVVSAQCFGEFQGTLAEQLADMAALENALNQDGQSFYYSVNDSIVHSILNTADCVSGTRIVQKGFPKGDGTEFANRRSFSFTVQAVFDASSGDDLISWQESVEMIGNGGPDFFILRTSSNPVAIITSPATEVRVRQTGLAVGYSTYPIPPGYVGGTAPGGTVTEYGPSRRIIRSTPKQLGNGFRFYPIRWYFQGVHDPLTFGVVNFLPTNR
jgi:hypothetical protein